MQLLPKLNYGQYLQYTVPRALKSLTLTYRGLGNTGIFKEINYYPADLVWCVLVDNSELGIQLHCCTLQALMRVLLGLEPITEITQTCLLSH